MESTRALGTDGDQTHQSRQAQGEGRLFEVFEMFAVFNERGPRRSKRASLSLSKLTKLCKESGLLDRVTTAASIGCAFSEVKHKKRTTIGFNGFKAALRALAARRADELEEDPEQVYGKIVRKIEGNPGPLLTKAALPGVGVRRNNVYGRLTDHRTYRSTHKHRFDMETGLGKGRMGRTSLEDYTTHLSQLVRPWLGGRTDTLKDPTLTVDVIQKLGCSKPPTYMQPVHRGGSLPMLTAPPKMQLRAANSGWY